MTNFTQNIEFLMETQDSVVGGFGKWPDSNPGNCIQCYAMGKMHCRTVTLNFFTYYCDAYMHLEATETTENNWRKLYIWYKSRKLKVIFIS